ncbi:hypothetical protein GIB67_022948 [Kingdonia uniflora]|uniref:Poly [ADP-ribose] polymerase n=1 Tax=Kingdonia uniflora TaxID=39325 RepID=A0A7J7P2B3_9MAGN|nr:hypothetical protein GIB67_022948 [Kingdonia uniflora]
MAEIQGKVEALGEIEVATKLLKEDMEMQVTKFFTGIIGADEGNSGQLEGLYSDLGVGFNVFPSETPIFYDGIVLEDPLYSHYKRLQCEMTPLQADSKEFFMIERYMQNTHAKTHSNYAVDIVQIFRVSRPAESDRFKKFCGTNNRMLLWHGSRLTNWTGILSQGRASITIQTILGLV